MDYPAYGSTERSKSVSSLSDRKLAHSAQMFHYQRQKQQMLDLERSDAASSDNAILKLQAGLHVVSAISAMHLRLDSH